MLYWFLPYVSVNQQEAYTCSLPREAPSTSAPIPPLRVVLERLICAPHAMLPMLAILKRAVQWTETQRTVFSSPDLPLQSPHHPAELRLPVKH